MGGVAPPNNFKFARKLVKISQAAKTVGHSIFCDLFFSNNSLVTMVGQLVRTPPPPTEGVSAHHCTQAEILAANHINFQVLLTNLCHFIVRKEHLLRGSHSLKMFHLEIMPLISKYYDVLENIVTFRSITPNLNVQ